MICAIHQPQTFPWLGYIAKIMQSDVFVILDNVQFKKNEWQNRNRIKTQQGPQWLTVPVLHNFGQLISEVEINNNVNWRHKHIQSLQTNYAKADYFNQLMREIEEIYDREWNHLREFNLAGIKWILRLLKINTPIFMASEIPELKDRPEITPDERLILITRAVHADSYLSGAGGRDYLQTELFPRQNIRLMFQQFVHPRYKQLHGDFISHLSVLDLLFNEGPDQANKIIKGGIR